MRDSFRHPIGLGLRSAHRKGEDFLTQSLDLFSIAEMLSFVKYLKMSIYTQTPVITAWGRNPVIVDSTSDAKKTYGTTFRGTGFIIPTPCSLQ